MENIDRMSLPDLQDKMRHASRNTTIRYVAAAQKRGVEDLFAPAENRFGQTGFVAATGPTPAGDYSP